MAQGSSGSYYDDYMRSNAMLKHCGEKNTKKLLTDRNAYISFLEVQLERVSAACLTTQTFERRLGELESAQAANDQKVGSLSKIFRLNQEYVEQTTQQTQSEIAGHASKVDAWMEKFSAELERQQPRIATLEEQFRQCQEYLPSLAETNDAAIHDVKHQAEQEIEALKAQVDTSLSAETLETAGRCDIHTNELQQRLNRLQQDLDHGQAEVKGVLKKCLDTQHLLSGTVVALQSEVDDVKKEQTITARKDSEVVSVEIEHLREGQSTLKNALQLLQACALEAQQASEDRCCKLADRLAAVEDSIETRTDDLVCLPGFVNFASSAANGFHLE
ncbi:unnamed protein product [Phytophthora lilii]|uniref:Unnamed protein product n=1 Tax=Phytophthora lilii TaxID=2077276 RepID=A0A9W6U5H3_9STRA|nr:unnamed protein product [Phytophthora lilii]